MLDGPIDDGLQGFTFLPGQFAEHFTGRFANPDRCGWHISCPKKYSQEDTLLSTNMKQRIGILAVVHSC
jgi:hypothetical protein